ncbi:MerR family transcriptional regulator [Thermanaeromonas toyohensis]|uniref:MerR family transcriptional regulator n=1 Tax=Thermanaeromonas toyohensis TaxID=161154 RepID=UPI0012F507A0|nr:MerR family transcriptional regulator [Thermanaeromonas toyohensis]
MVIQLLNISPGRLKNWERKGLIRPRLKEGRRCYSELDLQRLMFIKNLLDKRHFKLVELPGYLNWYPCWQEGVCPPGCATQDKVEGVRPCWQRKTGWYCQGDLGRGA